jgi:glycosyltransferase involved in cell wall biosynthesis
MAMCSSKKAILMISPIPTHPTDAGNRAGIYQILKSLNEMGHDVHFLYVNTEPKHVDEKKMAECWGDGFHFVPYKYPRRSPRRYFGRLKFLFEKRFAELLPVDYAYDPSLDNYLLQLAKRIRFDVVIVEYVFWSKALECFGSDVLKVIDTHDVFTNRQLLHQKTEKAFRWYATTAKEEAKALNRADVIIARHEKEKQFFEALTRKKVITVGHMVALHKPSAAPPTKGKILFVGSDSELNTDGIAYFIRDMLPRIRASVPDAVLLLVGRVCTTIEDAKDIVKLGVVENLAPVYDSASLVISPIRYGTGQSAKTIEALGHAKPVVSTSVGARGLDQGGQRVFLVADTPAEFSECVINVLKDSRLSEQLSAAAYEYANKWNNDSIRQLTAVLNQRA